jgi:competence protein ComGC
MDLQPGTTVTIANDIVANNQIVFQRGEQVVIESVSPNLQQPDYKYVVLSRFGARYQLRDVDIVSPQPYQPPMPLQQPAVLGYAGVAEKKGFPVWGIILIVAAVLVVIAGVLIIPVFMSFNANGQRRTCQANLRTIDGAINTYNAMNDTYPTSMDQLVPEFIKRNPTCPTSGESYTLELTRFR